MKILHFSDTHLGFNDLDIINKENINQREADFYDAFCQIVEQIKIISKTIEQELTEKIETNNLKNTTNNDRTN